MILSSCDRKIYTSGSRAYDTVNVGTTANDGTGMPIRSAYILLNSNWKKLDAADIDMIRLSGHDSLIITTTAATNVTLPTSGTLRSSTTYQVDNLTVSGTTVYGLKSGDSTLFYTPVSLRDDASTIFPTIQSAAGDTSNYATPDKIGDLYIDTSAGKVYVSVATARGGWRILNYLLPLFVMWNVKRRKRK